LQKGLRTCDYLPNLTEGSAATWDFRRSIKEEEEEEELVTKLYLNEYVSELVVLEQLFDKEDPAYHKKDELGAQHLHGVAQKPHFGTFKNCCT
jgi:hypothetical protein